MQTNIQTVCIFIYRKMPNHSISIKWKKYKNVLTPSQQFGNLISCSFATVSHFACKQNQNLVAFDFFFFGKLDKWTWIKSAKKNRVSFIDEAQDCFTLVWCKTKRLYFIFLSRVSGAANFSPNAVFLFFVLFFCNKRHNSCWTIWISTYNDYFFFFALLTLDRSSTDSPTDTSVHNNLISRVLARTVIENILYPKAKPKTDKQTVRLTLETLGSWLWSLAGRLPGGFFTDLLLAAFLSGYVTLREISNVIILTVW